MSNEHEKARFGQYANKAIPDRNTDELIGLARGLIADGLLNDAEISFLHQWLLAAEEVRSSPVLCRVLGRVIDITRDKHVSDEERTELYELLNGITGEGITADNSFRPTTIPLSQPQPPVQFQGHTFCFTGTFEYGPRRHCEEAVSVMGGHTSNLITQKLSYLVIGHYVTDAWKHTTFGRKIESAVVLRDKGFPVHIITEAHWRSFL